MQSFKNAITNKKVFSIFLNVGKNELTTDIIDDLFKYLKNIEYIIIFYGENYPDLLKYIKEKSNLKLVLVYRYETPLIKELSFDLIFKNNINGIEMKCDYDDHDCTFCINMGLKLTLDKKITPFCGSNFFKTCLSSTNIKDFEILQKELNKKSFYVDINLFGENK
jgi:hypothetical protein